VTVTTDSADLFTDQSLPPDKLRSRNKSGTDFFRFAESLSPATLTAPGGSSESFVSQASTIETPAQPPFPVTPVRAISTSGRGLVKTAYSASTGFETDAESGFSAGFQVDVPTPFLFDGSLITHDTDRHDCSDASVSLSSYLFIANDGGECGGPGPASKSFVVTGVLPPGGYTLNVGFDAAVGTIKAPSRTVKGKVLVDVALEFKKPCTIEGTSAGETLPGTTGNDVICGYGGNDIITGGDGRDYLIGDEGEDDLSGDGGDDHIFARDKTVDVVKGGPGNHDVAYVDKGDTVRGVEIVNP
jgi:Ca2+-binding RTX toxin-like protein